MASEGIVITEERMKRIDDIEPAPWGRNEWTGALVSLEGCPANDFSREDVAEVIACGRTADDWSGEAVAIVRLRDGRYAAWETWWDATGDGFYVDAYGGDTDIMFACDEATARQHLSERARELLEAA